MLKSTVYQYALIFVLILVNFTSTAAVAQTIIRVDAQSTASTPDGTTWALAYPNLRMR